ncbi:19806_t:CDS:2, partial [Cetraspora pellucida]
DIAPFVDTPIEFSLNNKEDEFNYIDILACEEPKSITNKNGEEAQYGECQIIKDDNTRCAQKIKVVGRSTSNLIHHLYSIYGITDSQINITKTHLKAKNNFLVRSLLKLLIRENLLLNLVSKESFHEFVHNLDSAFAIPCEKTIIWNTKEYLHLKCDVLTRWNSSFLAWERLLLKIMLTNDEWNLMNDLTHLLGLFNEYTEYFSGSEYVTISMMYPLITALKIKLWPKKRQIKINTPTNTNGLLDHIKLSLYKALLHYWPTPDINIYLAYQLDPRCKRLHVLSTDKQNQIEETLHAVYTEFKKQHCLSKQVTSLISKSVSMTNQNKKQAYRKGFIKSVFSPSL